MEGIFFLAVGRTSSTCLFAH